MIELVQMNPAYSPAPILGVLAGPSGSGKTTLTDMIVRRSPFRRCITTTTRPPRDGEVDGVHYRFLSPFQFALREQCGEFIETALVHGRKYGTRRADLVSALRRYGKVILNIDVQGYLNLKAHADGEIQEAMLGVFITVPGPDVYATFRRRISAREPDIAPEELARRLETAKWELDRTSAFDCIIVNDDREKAVTQILRALMTASIPR
ncbi:MAG: guanylate kinase [Patescibacteria group bacterium]|nr:guanylate kinase [Patescibacteria group bacterium]MDE2116715.1 guanylate kinase [Patescibacteria group bacterium]